MGGESGCWTGTITGLAIGRWIDGKIVFIFDLFGDLEFWIFLFDSCRNGLREIGDEAGVVTLLCFVRCLGVGEGILNFGDNRASVLGSMGYSDGSIVGLTKTVVFVAFVDGLTLDSRAWLGRPVLTIFGSCFGLLSVQDGRVGIVGRSTCKMDVSVESGKD